MDQMNADFNPSVPVGTASRQFQMGLLISSNLPTRWYETLTESGTTLKALVDWCVQTEEHIYLASRSEQEYFRHIRETTGGAIQVDYEFKNEYNAVGIVPPDHPAFRICQYLCQVMEQAKITEDAEVACTRMMVCCGILDFPEPRFTGMNPTFDISSQTRLTWACAFLCVVFPDPYPFPPEDFDEVLTFGVNLERQLYMRSNSPENYFGNVKNMQRQLMEFRIAENMYLDNEITLMEYFLIPGMLEYMRNRGQLNDENNRD